MACEVKTFGNIKDLRKVQEYFGLGYDENWLNGLNYGISPTGELIALAQGEKLALLSTSWSNKTTYTYTLTWCGELEDPNQIVTAVLCLPIYGRNVISGPEWTCIALGLSSGMVVFYTDAGIKIFSQSCHDDPVISLKCYSPPRHSEADSIMYIVYNQCVSIIKGADIFPLLVNMRHNINCTLGRISKAGTERGPLETADVVQFQKFKFSRDRDTIINDAVVLGAQDSCIFDHIVEQCISCGHFAKISQSPVQSSIVLGVGAEPCLGFYYAEEGYKTLSLGEVAKDVIGIAYKNILGNLFGRTTEPKTPDSQPPSPTKETQMRTRTRFYDGKRDGFTIAIAPGGRLAAVTDSIDRVMLVDAQRAVILRVWKGYRDAQCAFIPVKEKTLKGVNTHRRKALFLIIYTPRLGCLEIWALQNGPKVAAFTVCKSGQLAYNTHGLLGIQPQGSKVRASVNCCLFLDPSDATVKEIQIPFHYALSESNSKTSRDIHLLRQLKHILRDADHSPDPEEVTKLAEDFQTIEVRNQCIEMLKKNKQLKPKLFQTIIKAFAQSLSEEEDQSEELKDFEITIQNYMHLVDFYITLQSPTESEFDEHLELCDSDLVIINQLVLLLGTTNAKQPNCFRDASAAANLGGRVTFQDKCKDDGDFVDYLSIFQVDVPDRIPLHRSKADLYGYVSGKLFGEFFERGLCFEQFKLHAEQSTIPYEDLLMLALYFWTEKPFQYQNCDEVIADMSRLAAMIRTICELAGNRVTNYDYNSLSPWWQAVREMLLESPKSLGLLVAIVCKTVASTLRRSRREGSCDENSQSEEDERWERISHDEAQFCLLIGKLEDIAILGAILEYPLTSSEPVMPELPFEPPNCSLKFIVTGGKGVVTDITAQWLINSQVHPSKIVEPLVENQQELTADKNNLDEIQADSDTETKELTLPKLTKNETPADPVLEKLALLREHFPFSLQSGMLLSLMSWQYMVYWSKNLKRLEYISAALTCLDNFQVQDLALKHGICCMLWNVALKYPLQSTMKLIQKVGRLPKDKMCQQDIEMSAALVPDFLELSLNFLHHFRSSLEHDKRELKFEESLTEGQLPLQFIALQQHHAIKELLQLHYELCSVLHFIAFFQLKLPKPLSIVFDSMSNKAFFTDINKEPNYVLPAPDLILQQQREKFLCDVITASMDLIREDLEQLYVVDHMQYMEKVYALAESWKLNTTSLKRRQVVEMYSHGYDNHGEALLQELCEDETMGRMLLDIAGRRLNLYASKSQSNYMKIASIGQQLMQYLDELNEPSNNAIQITATEPDEIDIPALYKLIANTFKCLKRRETRFLHVVAQMFDACSLLLE